MKDKNLKVPAVVVTGICIIFLIIDLWCKTKFSHPILITIVYPLLEMICSITITAAIGTYFIEWKGFVGYIKTQLSEILSKPSMVKNLNNLHQSKLMSTLLSELTGVDSEKISGFMEKLYQVIRAQADIYGFYLLEQQNYVTCKLYKDQQGKLIIGHNGEYYRLLHHTRTSTYGNLRDGKSVIQEILFVNTVVNSLPDNKSAVRIISVTINSRRLKQGTDYVIEVQENKDSVHIDTVYSKQFICKLKKPIEIKKETKVIIDYDTITPVSDFSYCTRMNHLCKRFTMTFEYVKEDFNIYPQAFSYGGQKNQQMVDNRINIDLDDWLFPGEGINIFIEKK